MLTGAQVIVVATPVFLLSIAAEYAIGRWRGRDTYRWADAMASVGLGIVSQLVSAGTKLFGFGVYALVFQHLALWRLPADAWWVWLAALLGYDLCYYAYHRFGHRVALGWAAHAVHHQSEDYNLSTALRQTSTGFLTTWVFYLPLAVLGVPPLVFGVVALVQLLYQFWPHTQQIGKLGWFDRWFCSPSNHRVHHAVNDRYVDKNYGGILILWDRLFGTFVEEDDAEPCVYGTRSPLRSWNPLAANLQVYRDLLADSRHATRWTDKLRVWLAPPGWRPADVAARWPKPAFQLADVERYDPVPSTTQLAVATLLFVAALGLTSVLLWNVHQWPLAASLAAALGVVLTLSVVAWLTSGSGTAAQIAAAARA
ncbi:MAG: sterol desaturase family protein [Rubrivivax sp.]|nr:sterol desaturase family protein [Rubrivivax sp.]